MTYPSRSHPDSAAKFNGIFSQLLVWFWSDVGPEIDQLVADLMDQDSPHEPAVWDPDSRCFMESQDYRDDAQHRYLAHARIRFERWIRNEYRSDLWNQMVDSNFEAYIEQETEHYRDYLKNDGADEAERLKKRTP